jgi:UDP-N-acetylmuramate dehydrogenase
MSLDEILKDIADIKVEENIDLTKYTTMKLLAHGDLIVIKSLLSVKKVVKALTENRIDYTILGWGANMLLPKTSSSPYLKLEVDFDRNIFEANTSEFNLPASVSLSTLTSVALQKGFKGWEVFTGIPATLGGAIAMNAGTNLGEISSLITDVIIIDKNGIERSQKITANSFGYRKNNFLRSGDIVISAKIKHFGIDDKIKTQIQEYLAKRNSSQPMQMKTCGCVFKNRKIVDKTCHAGGHIDRIGLKGLSLNGVQVSQKHANFMENIGNATYEDVLGLIEIINDELNMTFGWTLETEVRL